MNIFPRYIFGSALIFILIMTDVYSQSRYSSSIGGLPGAPMRMGFGARGIAMGNAMTGVINGDLQSYYNPANVPFQSKPIGIATYSVLSLDRQLNYLSYTSSLKPNAGFSFSLINSGVGNIDGRNRDGIHTDTYSTSENAIMFAFGLKPTTSFSLGVTIKVYYYVLFEGIKSTTAAIDFGTVYHISQEFIIGAVIQDINAKYKWDTSHLYGTLGNATLDRFPLRKRIGLSWVPSESSFILSGEFESIGSTSFFRIGSEIELIDNVAFRGGIDQIDCSSDLPIKPSLGFSFQTELASITPSFQYAYVFEPFSPSGIHILSLAIRLK